MIWEWPHLQVGLRHGVAQHFLSSPLMPIWVEALSEVIVGGGGGAGRPRNWRRRWYSSWN